MQSFCADPTVVSDRVGPICVPGTTRASVLAPSGARSQASLQPAVVAGAATSRRIGDYGSCSGWTICKSCDAAHAQPDTIHDRTTMPDLSRAPYRQWQRWVSRSLFDPIHWRPRYLRVTAQLVTRILNKALDSHSAKGDVTPTAVRRFRSPPAAAPRVAERLLLPLSGLPPMVTAGAIAGVGSAVKRPSLPLRVRLIPQSLWVGSTVVGSTLGGSRVSVQADGTAGQWLKKDSNAAIQVAFNSLFWHSVVDISPHWHLRLCGHSPVCPTRRHLAIERSQLHSGSGAASGG